MDRVHAAEAGMQRRAASAEIQRLLARVKLLS